MTTNEEQEQDELIAAMEPLMPGILTAQIRAYQRAGDDVLEDKDAQIAELQRGYVKLWEAVERANESVDSLRIERILDLHNWTVASAKRALDPHDF